MGGGEVGAYPESGVSSLTHIFFFFFIPEAIVVHTSFFIPEAILVHQDFVSHFI
jgi:hypothetical protein